jgi:tRNA threonylcarbamoyl adenosine modification protein (Sua5/YciO/YrdC/YwlC family)
VGAVERLAAPEPPRDLVGRVARALDAGQVAVLPTDTVYGVACSVAACPDGAAALFAIKRRDPRKAIPWLVGDPSDLARFGSAVPAYAERLARALWPGALTLVVRAAACVPDAYRGPGGTVALRVPDAALVRALARACGGALAVTSANTSGLPAPTSFDQVERRIVAEAATAVDAGPCPGGVASTIVDCTGPGPRVLRAGALSAAQLGQALSQA